MKKILLLCVVAGMGITLAACDTKTNVDDTTSEVSSTETEMTDAQEVTNQEEETSEETVVAEEEKPLYVKVDSEYYYDDTINSWEYFDGHYATASVLGEDYPELKAKVDVIFASIEDNYVKEAIRYIEDAQSCKADMGDDFQQYSIYQDVQTTRTDGKVLSLKMTETSFAGGAHGNSYTYGITLDAKTGEEISLEALGDIKTDVKAHIVNYLNSDEDIKEGLFDDYEATIDTMLEGSLSWYLTGQSFDVVLNAYDVAPYVYGSFNISIPYADLVGFNKDYLPSDSAFYLTIPEYGSVSVDIGLDGKMNQLSYSKGELLDDYYYEQDYLVMDGVRQVFDSSYYYDSKAYFLQTSDGKQYVLVTHVSDNDYKTTTLYDMTSGVPMALSTKGMGIYGLANNAVWAGMKVDVLGSFYCYDIYQISNDDFVRQSERYEFDNAAGVQFRRGPVLKQALKVALIRDGVTVEEELPAGTRIYPMNTDGETVVGFELEDGTYGEIPIKREDYTITINGISEFDLFDELPYAG